MINYITYSDLAKDVRENIWKIPHDIDVVLSIPRSGLIPGIMIAEYFNIPITTVDNLVKTGNIEDSLLGNGRRLICKKEINGEKPKKKILVVDDTFYSGAGMKEAQEKLKNFDYDFVYLVVYTENPKIPKNIIYFRDISLYGALSSFVFAKVSIFEWNLFHHGMLSEILYDIDGVIFNDPPDERNEEAYLNYIKNPIPKFIPQDLSNKCLNFATYRLNKYRDITYNSLQNVGIKIGHLYMFNAENYNQRNITQAPYIYKGIIFKEHEEYKLFVESDDYQAQFIHNISGKPVLSIEKNIVYN